MIQSEEMIEGNKEEIDLLAFCVLFSLTNSSLEVPLLYNFAFTILSLSFTSPLASLCCLLSE